MTPSLPAVVASSLPVAFVPLIDWDTTSVYGADGQFEATVVSGAVIKSGACLDDLRKALAAVELALKPCDSGAAVLKALNPMYVTRRNRPGSEVDEAGMLAVYGGRLREYPFEVLCEAAAHFIDASPWMPAISEMLPVVERRMRPLRALKTAIERALARATATPRPQIAAPAPPKTRRDSYLELIVIRRQKGDEKGAAITEAKFAAYEKRDVEAWARPILDEMRAADDKARAEYQQLADEHAAAEARKAPPVDPALAKLAQERRNRILGGDRGSEEAA